jgi:hypothetical protein
VQGGIFLTSTYGALGGQYLVGTTFQGTATGGVLDAINSTGAITSVGVYTSLAFGSPVLAPTGFGSVAGEVLIPDHGTIGSGGQSVNLLSTNGSLTTFATTSGINPFGAVFAPAGFGSIGGELLVSDLNSGAIDVINSSGIASLFTTIPLGSGQFGLRQMAFAPAGFGMYGGDLFVSVSGSSSSNPGGGALGSVVVVNSSGSIIATLAIGTSISAFDPRGIYFAGNSQVLIASSDPIYSATSTDFITSGTTPEPATWSLLAAAALLLASRKLRPQRDCVARSEGVRPVNTHGKEFYPL